MSAVREQVTKPKPHVPGEVGVWVFILGDMLIFGLFFIVFVYYRGLNVELYAQSQATLNQNYGAINTLFLLASSWFVAMGVDDMRNKTVRLAPVFFPLAMLCGLGFGVVKIIEYSEKISAGITITSNDFYMYYYIFTGLHFLHVLIGMGVLVFLWHRARLAAKNTLARDTAVIEKDRVLIESGASYWHMVDLLWIVLFPLLYLMK
ncbi:MAG: cytochrome c oxidase subunit 3 family protein [Gammaproteobacteria bacterium]|nr:MAG: cytochrome c oxidase subunit 3 family protein [Gammaproteobacteria bacterium]